MHKHIQHTDTHLSCHTHLRTVKRRLCPGGQKLLSSGLVYAGSECCWDCVMCATPHRERERSGGTLAQYIRGVNNLQSVTHARRRRLGERACIIVKVLTVKISPHCSSGMQIVREVRKCKCK